MTRKEKKSKKKDKNSDYDKSDGQISDLSKLDVMQKIDDLKGLQQANILEGNNEKAIINANQIIELAIRYNMTYYMKEQEEFLQIMAVREQQHYLMSEIEKECVALNKQYDTMVESNEISQAHELIETFKIKNIDNPLFGSVPSVKALIAKDNKIYIEYQSK